MKKVKVGLAAWGALLASVGVCQANTIQPIIESVIPASGGQYTYLVDFELTPNNFLKEGIAAPVGYPSSVTILDFGNITYVSSVSTATGLAGPNITSSTDWNATVQAVGSALPNYDGTTPGIFKLWGSNGQSVTSPDNGLSNLTLQYIGSGVEYSTYMQRSLIQFAITTDLVPGQILNSVDTNGNPFTGVQQVDTYSMVAYGVPEPTTLSMGLLGLAGLLVRRRRA